MAEWRSVGLNEQNYLWQDLLLGHPHQGGTYIQGTQILFPTISVRLIEGASMQGHFFESQGCSINGNSIVW